MYIFLYSTNIFSSYVMDANFYISCQVNTESHHVDMFKLAY